MKLLILTQKVDKKDPILGFFHRWVEEFAKQCEQVTVICLEEGEHDLPKNVFVRSLGKEKLQTKSYKLKALFRFYAYTWQERKNYDTVFVHMNPIYIVLGGVFWKILKKKIALWYTHKSIDWKLLLAIPFVKNIFTAIPETFRVQSKKVHVVGHGIDMQQFTIEKDQKKKEASQSVALLHVGRISQVKNVHILIKALALIHNVLHREATLTLIGSPITNEDKEYEAEIRKSVSDSKLGDKVSFLGNIPNSEIASHYRKADAVLNPSETGGVDKVVLEALASGTPVLASNKALSFYFYKYADKLLFKANDAHEIAVKTLEFLDSNDKEEAIKYMSARVRETSDIKTLIAKIIASLKQKQ